MTKEQKKKQRYSWWSYIREIVREYYERRPAELNGVAARSWKAVRDAIETTERMPDGYSRIRLVRMLHADRTYTLDGAANAIPCDRATAARWQRRFFEEVARNRGLLD